MLTLTTDTVIRSMSAQHPPVATARSGDVVKFITMDAMGNQWYGQDDFTIDDAKGANPATGPLFIEEAEPGDTLKVSILDIKLNDVCNMSIEPGWGLFCEELPLLRRKLFQIRDGKMIFNDKISLDVKPMIGVIGVAPKEGEVINSWPGDHGGNMDNNRIGIGASVYLPVNHKGALLAMGDVHALMSDGEACISGAESAAEITVKVEVVKKPVETIMVVGNGKVSTVCCSEDMREASERTARTMRHFLCSEVKMEEVESCFILSLVGDMGICEVVGKRVTCRTEVPLSLFEAYGYSFDVGMPAIERQS